MMLIMTVMSVVQAQAPVWWTEQNVLSNNAPDDLAVASVGQLKYMTQKAANAIAASGQTLPVEITNLLNTWNSQNPVPDSDLHAARIGQAKYIANLFYTIPGVTPPTGFAINAQASDDQPLVLGQLKYLFAFEIQPANPDSDADGLNDSFEQQIINADPNDAIDALIKVLPDDDGLAARRFWDFDLDGISNMDEFLNGTDLLVAQPGSDTENEGEGDGLPDSWEIQIVDFAVDDVIASIEDVYLSVMRMVSIQRFIMTLMMMD
jgi:hypothetical protein